VIDAHLGDTATDGFPIAEVAQRSPLEPGEDAGPGHGILEAFHPALEGFGFDDPDHGKVVNHGWQNANHSLQREDSDDRWCPQRVPQNQKGLAVSS